MTRSRTLVVAGAGTLVLYVVGTIALGTPPEASDSGAQVIAFFKAHQDGARVDAWITTFSTLGISVIVGLVAGLLPEPQRIVFILGGAALMIESAIQGWLWGALALHPGSLDPSTARALLDVQSFWGPILTGATMAMIGAVTSLGFSDQPLIPGWLKWLGVVAFLEQAAETVTVYGTHGFIEPGGDMNLLLGAGLTFLWLIGLITWGAKALTSH
jgi:hypothetical protein